MVMKLIAEIVDDRGNTFTFEKQSGFEERVIQRAAIFPLPVKKRNPVPGSTIYA